MPRDLFGDVTRPSISIGNRKWYTVPVSLLSHSFAIAILLVLPILAPALMPSVFTEGIDSVIVPIVPPAPAPPVRPAAAKPPNVNPNAAPIEAPPTITPETGLEAGFEQTSGVIDAGFVLGQIDRGIEAPAATTVATPPEPIRIGGTIRTPMKVRDAQPIYPPIAQAARVQGIVILEATIGIDGQVLNARILRSIPLLDQSALEAVRHWQFTPTLLNGVAVPVIMTVTVNFTLR